MSGLLFNKIAAGVLVVALIGAGGSEVWRRVTGEAHHGEAVVYAPGGSGAPHASAAEVTVAPASAETQVGEGAPVAGDAAGEAGPTVETAATEGVAASEPAAAPAAAAVPPAPSGPDYAALFAAANIEEGKSLAVKCSMCHDFTEANKTLLGPPLYDLFGRKVASVAGFNYSAGPGSLSSVAGEWDAAKLDKFLENPKDLAPNTMMVLAGMKREGERINLMAYIRTLTAGEPKPVE